MGLNVKLLRGSFEVAKPLAGEIADKFYEFLWQDYPVSEGLFKHTQMKEQKDALMNSLVFIVDHLEDSEKLSKYLMSMGARHVSYGAEAEHYDWVGATLLKTFAYFFGDDWTDQLNTAWAEAYGVIVELMLKGAATINEKDKKPKMVKIEPVKTDELNLKARAIAKTLLQEAISEAIDDEIKEQVRVEVRKVIDRVLNEESKKLLGKKAA